MNGYEFWLASNSPRRREMLGWSQWKVHKISSDVNESIRESELPESYVRRLSVQKSTAIHNVPEADFILAADTIVVMDNAILGKPSSEDHAFAILSRLRSRSHQVITALSVRQGGDREPLVDMCRSEVVMRNYSDQEICQYIKSGDPMDKAGAYAIQNNDFHPVINFRGCVASVMGLPLCHLERTLEKFSSYKETNWPQICQKKLKYKCPVADRIMTGEDIG